MTTVSHDYALVPPGRVAKLLPAAMALVALLAFWLVPSGSGHAPHWGLSQGALMAVVFAIIAIVFYLGLNRRSVRLDDGRLRVSAGLRRYDVAVAELDLARARIVDLAERTELAPRLRTSGLTLPGYWSGWYRTRELRKTFCLITARDRVLWLPEHTGGSLLLSLQQPQQLLDALRTVAPGAALG